MRPTFLDCCLIVCFFSCALILAFQGDVLAAPPMCDTKCREITIYFEDQGGLGINCFNWDLIDCQVCATGSATCLTTDPPGNNTCLVPIDPMPIQYSPATQCTLKCNLPVGSWARASGLSGNNWKGGGNQELCQ